jgi:hypothetical protein
MRSREWQATQAKGDEKKTSKREGRNDTPWNLKTSEAALIFLTVP